MSTHDVLPRFRGCRILVVGDVMLDEYVWGNVSRISPEAPVPVVEVQRQSAVAGGAGNTATNIAALGGEPVLAGVRGADAAGERLTDWLSTHGVDVQPLVPTADRPTITKTRILAHGQQIVRIDQEDHSPLPMQVHDALFQRIEAVLPSVQGCVISDYGKGILTADFTAQVILACQQARIPIVVDPKGVDYRKYAGATVVKPNQLEAGKVLNRELRDPDSIRQAGRDLLALLGGTTSILVTQGSAGMTLFERSRAPVHVPALAREVFDVTGAGDTVAGTLALTLASGASLETACRLASIAAAIVVGKVGTATVSLEELQSGISIPMRQAA